MKRIFIMISVVALLSVSCSDWFDVNPATEVKAEEIFSKEQGFYDALMGVYVQATAAGLYGQQLSYGSIDVLADMYTVTAASTNASIQGHNYENINVKPMVTSFWGAAYTVIANCNSILEYMPGKEAMFYPGNYALLEAETRAFRAFLHFDLLRLYGPFSVVSANKKAIPYVDAVSKVPFPQLTVSQVLDRVIGDLERAHELLKKNDPLFVDPSGTITQFMDYLTPKGFRLGRSSRLNYYAVTGLLARVYLYKGDVKKAYTYALEVYKSDYAAFKDIDKYAWTDDLLAGFTVYKNFNEVASKVYFSKDAATNKLLVKDDARGVLYETGKYQTVDVRYLRNFGTRDNETETFLNKYFGGSVCYSIIKRSEIYLILAETAQANQDEPFKYLNELRAARGLSKFPLSASMDNLDEEIMKEYRKEFVGEGQLFYFYKRKRMTDYTGVNSNLVKGMQEYSYKLPLPDGEKNFGEIE